MDRNCVREYQQDKTKDLLRESDQFAPRILPRIETHLAIKVRISAVNDLGIAAKFGVVPSMWRALPARKKEIGSVMELRVELYTSTST